MRKLLKISAALPVLFLFLACAQNVYADSVTFDFSFSGVGITGSGSLTATFVSGNEYLVTSITGMQNGASMTLLAPKAYGGNDNEIFSSKPFLNSSGLAFVLSSGTTDYNIYFDPNTATYMECNSTAGPCSTIGDGVAIKGTLTEVPEPGTLILLGSGLVGLTGMARRKLLG
jgi:hypothetical protein